MREILPGVLHWRSFHEGIGAIVHSYYLAATDPAVLIDPRIPEAGLAAFDAYPPPRHAYLTNRHHYRHSGRFEQEFGTEVWCHEAGLHEFTHGETVRPFKHGYELPGGIQTVRVGVLCPEETALLIPGGILAIGDAIVRDGDDLAFVPDALLGDDPQAVKQGLRDVFLRHLDLDFDHLLFAHGEPLLDDAKAALRQFLESIRI